MIVRRFLLALVLWLAVGAMFVTAARLAEAQGGSIVQDTASAPQVQLTPDVLLRFWSNQAGARGVTTDAQWATAMATLFSATNFPGADPTALAFLRSFFTQYVHVGP